jgi:proteasome accessory factor C
VNEAYDLSRLRRLLLLLPAAARAATRHGRGVPLAEAVRITGARSVDQVIEDVETLADLYIDPGQGETLIDLYIEDGEVQAVYAEPFNRPPALSLAEGAVLLSALAPFEKATSKGARGAARRLRRAIPEPLRPEADRLAGGLDLVTEPPGPWAGALREAIDKRVETTLEYRAVADAGPEKRVVEPRLLFQRDGNWYLAAWNPAKEAEHLYRLDRIVTVELGTRVFGAHRGPPLARYAKQLYFESGAEREVSVRFRGAAAALARDRYGDRARPHDDGTVSVTLKVTPGNYLLGFVLGFGGDATVEAPANVAAQLKERVEALERLYR